MPNRPVSDQRKQRVLAAIRAGKGRNEIAREIGVGAATVTKIAEDAGLDFDRTATEAATKARRADLAAKRAELQTKLLARAGEFLDAMDGKFLVFAFGGKDNTYSEHQLDRPPTGDIKNLMTAVGIAIQREAELSRAGEAATEDRARSLWQQLHDHYGLND